MWNITRKAVGLWHSRKHGIHTDVSDDKLLTTTIAISIPKNLYAWTCKWFWAVLPGQKQLSLCIFKEHIWLSNRKCNRKKMTCFDQEEIIKMAWYCTYRFLDVLIPMAQVLRLYIQMFLSYGLYVCIILETAHHRTTFRIFCNITQKTTPEENSHKMFHISSPIVLFS